MLTDRLAAVARSRSGVALVAGWACAEAVLLPIVPDVVLLPLVAAAPREAPRLTAATFGGALVGSMILAALVARDPSRVRSRLLALPGIDEDLLRAVEAAVAARGARPFAAFGPGVPLKVDTFVWVAGGGSPLVLAGAAVLNRLTRVGPGIVIASAVGSLAPVLLRRHERLALVVYVTFWVSLYASYWDLVGGVDRREVSSLARRRARRQARP